MLKTKEEIEAALQVVPEDVKNAALVFGHEAFKFIGNGYNPVEPEVYRICMMTAVMFSLSKSGKLIVDHGEILENFADERNTVVAKPFIEAHGETIQRLGYSIYFYSVNMLKNEQHQKEKASQLKQAMSLGVGVALGFLFS